MTIQEQAHIVAIVKLCGSSLSNDEILHKYDQYRREYLSSENPGSGKVEVFKRPF